MNPEQVNKISAWYEIFANFVMVLVYLALLFIAHTSENVYLSNSVVFGLGFQLGYLFSLPGFLSMCLDADQDADGRKKICQSLQFAAWFCLFVSGVIFLVFEVLNGL